MPRKPNYDFERRERERLRAIKVAAKAEAKKQARETAKGNANDAATVEPTDQA